MQLQKWHKILVGLATAWMIIYPVLFVALTFGSVALVGVESASASPEEIPVISMLFTGVLFPVHCLTIFMIFGLMAFYLMHILKNEAVSDTMRLVFGIGIFVMPYIVMPIYYYAFLWRDTPPAWVMR